MKKMKELLQGSCATSLLIKKHHNKFVVFFYRSPDPLFGERKDTLKDYCRYVNGGYPNRDIKPVDCEPVNRKELKRALAAIEQHEAQMAEYEKEQERWLENAERILREDIQAREDNRINGDNTVYADDVAFENLRGDAFRWVDYIMP